MSAKKKFFELWIGCPSKEFHYDLDNFFLRTRKNIYYYYNSFPDFQYDCLVSLSLLLFNDKIIFIAS